MSVVPEPTVSPAPSALNFDRIALSAGHAAPGLLGGRLVGAGTPDAVHSPLLAPGGAWLDAWSVAGPVRSGRHGCVSYQTDGEWLHGAAILDERDIGMRAASQRVYADIFTVLASQPCSHLLRIWNYFADINGMAEGSERYRQFNAGRQQAFLDVHRSAFEGSPAACALGTHDGPLQVFFLAGRQAPTAIENPRQVSAYRYPETYGPRAPTFSRAAVAGIGGGRHALFISGTASIVGHASMHVGDVARQTEESLVNVDAVRAAAEQRSGLAFPADQMIHTVYVRRAEDMPAVRAIFERGFGAGSPAARHALYLQADVCRSELLVEIEAHGFAAAGGVA